MIRLVTDSVSSVPPALAAANGIELVPLSIVHGTEQFVDEGSELDAFYEKLPGMLDDPVATTTSLPSQLEFEERFDRIADAGDQLLGVFMGSSLSGTFDCALRAARSVAARHAGFRFRIVDSTTCCMDEGLPVLEGAAGVAAGADLDACARLVADAIASSRIVFAPMTLSYLQRGGRIGNAAALVGNLMKICPVLSVEDGSIDTLSKARTHKKALRAIREKLADEAGAYGLKDVAVQYVAARDEAMTWAHEEIEPMLGRKVPVMPCTSVVGVHVGPAIGVAYCCAKPVPGKLTTDVGELVFAS